jgi:Trm5-related predicted tRNA methylase
VGGGLVELERVELLEQRNEPVVNRPQLPRLFIDLRLVDHHDSPLLVEYRRRSELSKSQFARESS